MGRSGDDSSSVALSRRRRNREKSLKGSRSKSKKDERKKKSRRDYSSSDEDDSHYKQRKRQKKERKKEKKHKKEKRKKRRDDTSNDDDDTDTESSSPFQRNYELADALSRLLEERPALVEDLPILLIRLAGGSAFDLSQMTDEFASRGIATVFSCLEPYGLQKDTNGSWIWRKPDVGGRSASSELVLIGLVRAMLDQIGITMTAVEEFERPRTSTREGKKAPKEPPTAKEENVSVVLVKQTKVLLNQFQQGELVKELADLCSMILEGESISLDGLPDERLRSALESLFVECALEKSEMVEESDDDDERHGEEAHPTFGYGLPDHDDIARSRLQTVLDTCKSVVMTGSAAKSRFKGPMPRPASYAEHSGYEQESESDDDNEGPLLPGRSEREPTASGETVRASAAHRSLQLESVKQGIQAPLQALQDGGREEWMLVPGKFDLLSALKSGQPIRSRTFGARSKADAAVAEKPVDPSIQSEIDAIRRAHEESRGPSLLQQHREKKAQESEKAAGKKSSWKWDRDEDLDAGRKVDKNALNMLFGSAGSDLRSKFSSGT